MTSRSEDKKDPGGGEGAAGVRRMHKQMQMGETCDAQDKAGQRGWQH